jgi:hypothetical protein
MIIANEKALTTRRIVSIRDGLFDKHLAYFYIFSTFDYGGLDWTCGGTLTVTDT